MSRTVYSRDLKVTVMRALDAGAARAEIAPEIPTESEAAGTLVQRVAGSRGTGISWDWTPENGFAGTRSRCLPKPGQQLVRCHIDTRFVIAEGTLGRAHPLQSTRLRGFLRHGEIVHLWVLWLPMVDIVSRSSHCERYPRVSADQGRETLEIQKIRVSSEHR